ncbi:hypothetical protein C8R43DRAFT_1128099 [Mycena crocata]|nr:hypothetical protein C8R43DRAFT_1128099 [Mycena crocata]
MPLHCIEEWSLIEPPVKGAHIETPMQNPEFWNITSLADIGLVYQLGHGGLQCPRPEDNVRTLVVMDLSTIHKIKYKLCGCDRSDYAKIFKQLLRNTWFPASATDPDIVVGNVNVYDFIKSLECKTSPLAATGINKVPDRYKSFLRMSHQYVFIKRCHCAGCGHEDGGINATELGELMGGATSSQDIAFMEPEKYKEHLRKYVAESNISTCITFAALTQKETCNTAGLRVSGVGGCVCARHECVRPNGLGNLQKGERYANMDYILMSTLAGFDLEELTVSYDVACQWRKRLAERLQKLLEDMHLNIKHILFHLSFSVAKSDGEGIKRLWAQINSCAFHMKTMGIGNCVDTLEDKIDYLNHSKNLALANLLCRKLLVAIPEHEQQVNAFKEVNKSIPVKTHVEWQGMIDTFLNDDKETVQNPYIITTKDRPSEAEIRVLLKKDEEEAAKGTTCLHATGAMAFLTAGLQLEDTQRRIKAEIAGLTTVTADRESKIQEARLALLTKLCPFRELQQIYTPGATAVLEAISAACDTDAPAVKAENIPLILPLVLSTAQRATGCARKLPEMEAMLREAQCMDSLVKVRTRLSAKHHIIYWRGGSTSGQKSATRARTILGQLRDRINAVAKKYNNTQVALSALKGSDYTPHLKKLTEQDLMLDGDVKDDQAIVRKEDNVLDLGGARGSGWR